MTSILTEDEINGIADKHEAALGGVWPHEFAEAIIDATIKRLAAGASVEPVAYQRIDQETKERVWDEDSFTSHPNDFDESMPLYTATAVAAARVQALEEAAEVCDVTPVQPFRPSIEAAWAIRTLIGGPNHG